MSQESIIGALHIKPLCVISLNSSTLVNVSSIFNVPTISYAKILIKEDINLIERKNLEIFTKRFNGIIEFPDSINKLKALINELK